MAPRLLGALLVLVVMTAACAGILGLDEDTLCGPTGAGGCGGGSSDAGDVGDVGDAGADSPGSG